MDIVTVSRTAFRRWYVMLPILLATAAAIGITMSVAKPVYQTKAMVLVVGPSVEQKLAASSSGSGFILQPVNPLSYFGDSLKSLALTESKIMDSRQVREEIRSAGFHGDYEISVQPETVFLDITATAADPTEATRTLDQVVRVITAKSNGLQSAVPPDQRYRIAPLSEPPLMSVRPARSLKLLGTVAFLGVAAALGLALAVDAEVGRRARSRSRAEHYGAARAGASRGRGRRGRHALPEDSMAGTRRVAWRFEANR
ncbi:hypothetical protein ThrDRAFT_01979 [Frankia casuarinae]|uniref:Lipopolysaccharide biosynthesis n=1 Tax=Frankia casuarinae (strain DSM 45818 / CECT 9043 / HFP020203 / CcI3) TaxID=106370 RepID=Q2JCP8_FRACC|nr:MULTISPECIES: Wzz/FepE/Etk N-terminal domain-containing protein [Frankia]ABD10944.1 lipopolysaccharide biosynthesis [Frankia casuarinae]ETA02203.1 hypothetical protein CcI6DRAFT_02378 [Frankia sp. CcI6]EYT92369.1 hypothetical protein ThrDRAFT_01979 [Frankia casuarinae]KDA42886.1 hypothetical protein BMG523Draft_02275 [Frankia sp. BMG5.23]KFB06019.1 capsular polysaccharide biosynthesis protein [Frankia sp. Allo2]